MADAPDGTVIQATSRAPKCVQRSLVPMPALKHVPFADALHELLSRTNGLNFLAFGGYSGVEDCLKLNVYVPAINNKEVTVF